MVVPSFFHRSFSGMTGVRVRILLVVLVSVLATAVSHPAWLQDPTAHNQKEGGESMVPLVLLPLPPRHQQQQLVTDVARKRNAEILNTLLGSQDLGYMRNAGRR
ncbi:uncharacterized protein [Panulirus ornatus]|uniref:uncharacterized protein n=1 Tax=Panulirus ornatus TaxID=150431 RepID=UPI003A86600F